MPAPRRLGRGSPQLKESIGAMPGSAIDRVLERRLAALVNSRESRPFAQARRGLEKESLRVTPGGRVARSPHPRALGSALTHPAITTDFSEALIELVTPTFTSNSDLQAYLADLHSFVHANLDEEVLWASSMPCELAGDADVPLAQYGRSHSGFFKHVYRRGLLNRYGGMMQAIAGVHFNYSFPKSFWPVFAALCQSRDEGQSFISASYFALLRNFRRHGWLLAHLFGASPALCRSFLTGSDLAGLELLDAASVGSHQATSLRMSDVGYRNRNQAGVEVSVNRIEDYIRDLRRATHTLHPAFQALGVKVDGEYRQLNANVLQIENEFYSSIRPKRVAHSGERVLAALARGGVEYIEVRALDLNPFEPTGVALEELQIVEALLVLLMLMDGAPIESAEQAELDANALAVARHGRNPQLQLKRDGRPILLRDWVAELMEGLQAACELLDGADAERPYSRALQPWLDPAYRAARLPAARWLEAMRSERVSFVELAQVWSRRHRQHFMQHAMAAGRREAFAHQVEESLEAQAELEARERGSFEDYLQRAFAD
ncbi:MAG: glutamate--cysteine ligase [Steroidobacteraceae bacterium]